MLGKILRGATALVIATILAAATVWAIPEGPDPNTPQWAQRESDNYARTSEAPNEQAQSPQFQTTWNARTQSNHQDWVDRATADPSWVGPPSGNSNVSPLSATWGTLATGDPTRYPDSAGPNGVAFYETEADVVPVVFYDAGCARISGRVWAPHGWTAADATLPGVVVENGSIQATEPLYWWFAQALVRAGYVAMTFDPRGQGRSDTQTPSGEQGGNVNSQVFFAGMAASSTSTRVSREGA